MNSLNNYIVISNFSFPKKSTNDPFTISFLVSKKYDCAYGYFTSVYSIKLIIYFLYSFYFNVYIHVINPGAKILLLGTKIPTVFVNVLIALSYKNYLTISLSKYISIYLINSDNKFSYLTFYPFANIYKP